MPRDASRYARGSLLLASLVGPSRGARLRVRCALRIGEADHFTGLASPRPERKAFRQAPMSHVPDTVVRQDLVREFTGEIVLAGLNPFE